MKRISFIEAGAPGSHIFSKFPEEKLTSSWSAQVRTDAAAALADERTDTSD